jgi:hypothetical protein
MMDWLTGECRRSGAFAWVVAGIGVLMMIVGAVIGR